MMQRLSKSVDRLSEFLAHRKGLLPIIGIAMILINFAFQLFPAGWLTTTNCFLHLGLLLAIIGLMVARAL